VPASLRPHERRYGDIAANKQPCRPDAANYTCPGIVSPHLDRVAAEGIRFTSWYTSHPVCTPSRAAILTGRYPIRTGAFPGVFSPQSNDGLPHSEVTIAEKLLGAGYQTSAAAKWHLGSVTLPDGRSFLPPAFGFQSYTGIPYSHDFCPCPESLTHTHDHKCRPDDPPCPVFEDLEVVQQPAVLDQITQRYANATIAALLAADKAGEPGFSYWGPQHTHHPQFARFENINASAERGGRPNDFGDSVFEVDEAIGSVFDAIRAASWSRPLVVFVTSDNGPSLIRFENGGSPGELRCGKGTTWEGGMRVPGLVWGTPGSGVRAGAVEDQLAASLDILPTVLGWAGVPVPDDRPIDGYDLSDLVLEGGSGVGRRSFMNFYGLTGTLQAVRLGDLKTHIYTSTWGRSPASLCELKGHPFGNYSEHPIVFDLSTDPGESSPLDESSDKYRAAVAAARAHIVAVDCFSTKDACAGHTEPACDAKNAPLTPPSPFHPWRPVCDGKPGSEGAEAPLCSAEEVEAMTMRPDDAPATIRCRPTADHVEPLTPYTFM